MGLFDRIEYEGKQYQTKDFDCEMAQFLIRDGRLYREKGHFIDCPIEEKPYPNAYAGEVVTVNGVTKRVGADVLYFAGIWKWIHEGWEDTNFHGVIDACGDDGDVDFKFTDGALVEVSTR